MSAAGPYDERYRQQMDAIHEGLWMHLELVPTLEQDKRDAVMRYLLDLACRAQGARNIVLGRTAILGLPPAWLLAHIEDYVEPLLQLEDEWEYRRVSEIYDKLDDGLVRRLAERGAKSRDKGIREASQELRDLLEPDNRSSGGFE